ncbi:hypothetical protein N789_11670 [Arenimonas oryziterrae DSM 21050 = YC6267]|uniref:GYF domain-containing protein n=2 Tax=Arenimonas TaxID=490567 RepID=A0A091AX12_9GAMM|nr:hypothetical protein N789_11670 [Arenimonas oryziterrae DSM 21050 = YC6267]
MYADRSGQQRGPVDAATLRDAYRRGDVAADALVWREGMAQWAPLSQVAAELGLVINTPPPLPGGLPPMSPAAQAAAYMPVATQKKSGLSGCWIIAIVLGVVFLVVMAMMAAIAIPAYQEYVSRAQFVEATILAEDLKPAVEQHYQRVGTCPTNESPFQAPETYAGRYVARIELQGGPKPCEITAIFRTDESVTSVLRGSRVTMSGVPDGDSFTWTCRSSIPERYRRNSCQ